MEYLYVDDGFYDIDDARERRIDMLHLLADDYQRTLEEENKRGVIIVSISPED